MYLMKMLNFFENFEFFFENFEILKFKKKKQLKYYANFEILWVYDIGYTI